MLKQAMSRARMAPSRSWRRLITAASNVTFLSSSASFSSISLAMVLLPASSRMAASSGRGSGSGLSLIAKHLFEFFEVPFPSHQRSYHGTKCQHPLAFMPRRRDRRRGNAPALRLAAGEKLFGGLDVDAKAVSLVHVVIEILVGHHPIAVRVLSGHSAYTSLRVRFRPSPACRRR